MGGRPLFVLLLLIVPGWMMKEESDNGTLIQNLEVLKEKMRGALKQVPKLSFGAHLANVYRKMRMTMRTLLKQKASIGRVRNWARRVN